MTSVNATSRYVCRVPTIYKEHLRIGPFDLESMQESPDLKCLDHRESENHSLSANSEADLNQVN